MLCRTVDLFNSDLLLVFCLVELCSDCSHHGIFMGAGGVIWHFFNFQEMIHLSHTFTQFYKVLPWVSRLQYSTFSSMDWLNKSLAALFRFFNYTGKCLFGRWWAVQQGMLSVHCKSLCHYCYLINHFMHVKDLRVIAGNRLEKIFHGYLCEVYLSYQWRL